jgi:hypothetical protein
MLPAIVPDCSRESDFRFSVFWATPVWERVANAGKAPANPQNVMATTWAQVIWGQWALNPLNIDSLPV